MSSVAIQVEGLSKLYHIGAIEERHDTLRDHLAQRFKSLLHRNGRGLALSAQRSAPSENTIWALKDVSFTINRGEVVGIIGRNGAGKSTLLKILSRITEPTIGFAEIHGRVGSLLEVGTGFHGELTGRENLYLNGAILGMRKTEIDRKFDEIVAFAEVEKFIDTPVKRYSSGMYLRLAFAVAAHLEPEILVVDEVLAVGDIAFQKKCLGKMEGMGRQGRTILFVSHNMGAIEHLCDRGMVLQDGKVAFSGQARDCVDFYVHTTSAKVSGQNGCSPHIIDLGSISRQSPVCHALLKRLELYIDQDKPFGGTVKLGGSLIARIGFCLENRTSTLDVTIEFDNLQGQRIFAAQSIFQPDLVRGERVGDETLVCEIPSLTLLPGEYKINVAMMLDRTESGEPAEDWIEDVARITIVGADYYGTGKVPNNGLVALQQRWYLL
jgi:lipopolysaccharide transport system ATP-binding protein